MRNESGVAPVSLLKRFIKWLVFLRPTSYPISLILRSEFSSSFFASLMRTLFRHWKGGILYADENSRLILYLFLLKVSSRESRE